MAHRAWLALVFLILALFPPNSRGEHGSPWLVASPDPSEPLPLNGRITLFADNGPHHHVVNHARLDYRLVADGDVVGLGATRFRRGDDWNGYGTSSIVLTPRRRLMPSTSYRLEIRERGGTWERTSVAALMGGPNVTYGGPGGGARWQTTTAPDRRRPRWIAPPFTEPDPDTPTTSNIVARVDDSSAVTFRIRARTARRAVLDQVTYHQDVFGIQNGCHWLPLESGVRTVVSIVPIDAAGQTAPPATITISSGRSVSSLCLRGS